MSSVSQQGLLTMPVGLAQLLAAVAAVCLVSRFAGEDGAGAAAKNARRAESAMSKEYEDSIFEGSCKMVRWGWFGGIPLYRFSFLGGLDCLVGPFFYQMESRASNRISGLLLDSFADERRKGFQG